MSEVVQWATLTPAQRDQLIAERIMGWKPVMCQAVDSTIDRMKWLEWNDSSQWCEWCGASESWTSGDDIEHRVLPHPAYTQSLDVAIAVMRRFSVYVELLYMCTTFRCKISAVIGEPVYAFAEKPAEAICIAALKSVAGVEVRQ